MAGRFLLDTNVVVDLLRGDPSLFESLEGAENVFLSSTILGELYLGARLSARAEENLERIESFASAAAVLPCDRGTSARYAEIKQRLRERGRPIPENDLWIAAVAVQHDLTLAIRDAHFGEVDGLTLVAW